ncbi:hypothetical protein G6011_01381 [Alternaria panax]|uniref:Uncharacterized protein n=1 Tax=Alternaria panax TaxID=48097 RepID=A0AAD4IKF0_9PLEO|nr:hypothetical protein G6011_01381 [Alternaria panax]
MASGTKKRRKSQFPVRGTASKRSCVRSVSTSNRSQHAERDANLSLAGSARDAHLVQKQSLSTALPSGEDWLFRVKVISSATNLTNDLFKNAVQGLVRICFPENMLNQLGPQVLERHMREEKAPKENIQRMSEIFRTETTQRIACMLAEYLETPAKVEMMVRAAVAASAKLHGSDLGEDILGHMITSLLQLKAIASENSTGWLANSDDMQVSIDSDGDMDTRNDSDEESPPLEKKRKRRNRSEKAKREHTMVKDDFPENANMDVDLPAASTKHRISKNRDKKISSKWQWDIVAVQLADDDVAEAFARTSDLFAYHALPIARRKIGSQASRKEIRCEMQSLLDGMPPDEFEKWVESLQKLLNGDREMLARQDIGALSADRQRSRATPAPVDLHGKARNVTKPHSGDFVRSKGRVSIVENAYEGTFVKRETAGASAQVAENPPAGHIVEATNAFRHLSTEERELGRPLPSVEAADRHNPQDLVDSAFGMPVLSLLWGSDSLSATECVNDSVRITQTIMMNLKNRVSAERIVVSGLGGMNKTRTTSELQDTIVHSFPQPGHHYSFMRIKKDVEAALVPWVIAEPSAFPELKAMPFVFAHTVPSIPVILNILFGSWSFAAGLSGSEMWDKILQALQRRGISEASVGAANINCLQIDSLCNKTRHPETTRRALLERVLRRLAFSHRERFPELKATPVVMTWERKTGLKW